MQQLFAVLFSSLVLFSSIASASVMPFENLDHQRLEAFRNALVNRGKVPPPQPQAPDTHVLFDSAQAAADWAVQVGPRLQASIGATRFNVLSPSDSRVAVLQQHVDALWRGYVELFPAETAGLNVPPVVLVDSEVVNAFVPKHLIQENKLAHTVVVLTALLDVSGGADNRELLSGMFGHELAHSVFRHGLPQYQARVNKYFNASEFRLGFQAVRNAELDAAIGAWANAATMAGDLSHEELAGLPSNGVARPIVWRVWNQMMAELFDSSPACTSAASTFAIWSAFQVSSPFSSSYSLNLADPVAVTSASEQLSTATTTCLGDRRRPFVELLATVLGMPADVLAQMPDIRAMAAEFDAATTSIEGLRGVVSPVRAAMVEVETAYPMGELGFFTYEEHADDVSLLVHRHLGWDPMSLANFFRMLISADDRARCDALIESGETPPTGSFSDPHRATCFRIAHLHELNDIAAQRDPRSFAAYYIEQTMGENQ